MKKFVKVLCVIALIGIAFLLGVRHGKRKVILEQNIWSDGVYHYAEYNGEVNYYE